MSSKVKIFALRKAIDSGALSKEQALIAISQGMEQRVRGYIRAHKSIILETLTDEFRANQPFLEQMEKLEITIEIIDKIAKGYLEQETLDKIKASLETKAKVGRNDPCLCDSGKKYKKCCGR